MGNRSNSQVIGYRYLLGIHMGISRGPVDELVEIKVGEKPAWRGSVTGNGEVNIDAANLFGGEDGEGGVQGTLTVMMGGPTQTAPAALGTVLTSPMPGFRRRFTAFFDGIVSMINPYPKPWKFRVRRALQGWDGPAWYPERAVITLVRETSAAEQQASGAGGETETRTVETTEQFTGFLPNGYDADNNPIPPLLPFSYTINPPTGATGVSITLVTAGSGAWDDVTNLVPGTDYTVSGNTVTIQPDFDLRTITVYYSYTITTVIPGTGPGGLGTAIIQSMNPAHILYECYTNREWGRGLPRDALNDAAFRALADRLFSERFGLCIRWTRTDEIQAFIQLILDHVGGVVYADRTTGLITPALIRDDYTRSSLPLFTSETGLLQITDAPVSAQGPLINEVLVKWVDPVTDQTRTARASNLANLQASGGEINSQSKDYLGLPTYELASRIAKRDLKAQGTKLRKFSLVLDRRGRNITPGSVIRVADPVRNISDTVVRVATVSYGTLTNGEIKVEGVQDVFGLPRVGLPALPPPTWTPPNTQPCLDIAVAFEMPYRMMRRALSAADFAQIDDSSAFLGTIVGQGQPLNQSYTQAVKLGAASFNEQPANENFLCGFDLPPALNVILLAEFENNLNDSSGNGNHFSPIAPDGWGYVSGQTGLAIGRFGGGFNSVQLSGPLVVASAGESFTVDLQLKFDNTNYSFGNSLFATLNGSFDVGFNSSGRLVFATGTTIVGTESGGPRLADLNWHLVRIARNGSSAISMSIDGVVVVSGSMAGAISFQNLCLMRPTNPFHYRIDNFRVIRGTAL